MRRKKGCAIALIVIALAILTSPAFAEDQWYGFYNITKNAPSSVDVASQLKVDVINSGSGTVAFQFWNDVGTASNISEIYFDDGALLSIASITNGPVGTVEFSQLGSPSNLPSGETLPVDFQTTAGFYSTADNPAPTWGIGTDTEWVKITFNLKDGKTYNDVLSALSLGLTDPAQDGSLRIGLHVTGIGTSSKSDSFVNGPPEETSNMPEPGSLLLLGFGLIGVGALARKKTKK